MTAPDGTARSVMTTSDDTEVTTVPMPELGEGVTECTVTRWLKGPGERVEAGEPLLEVATDKVDTEIPAPASGVIIRTLAQENDVVAIGAPLVTISQHPAPPQAAPAAGEPAPGIDAPVTPLPDAGGHQPSRPAGASKPTVHTHPSISNTETAVTEKLPPIRRTIARRMMQSLQTSAQLTTVIEVDVTDIARLRAKYATERQHRSGLKLSFLPFFAKAAVDALSEHRVLNASLNDDATEATYYRSCHLGVAVDTPKGLMVPVIRDADRLGVTELAAAISGLAERTRAGTMTPDELAGGTFTLTNTGSRGALFDTPIINHPQTAILGTGAVVKRVVPADDADGSLSIRVRSMAYLSLSYDHRIVDGADAARFLNAIRHRLENGFTMSDLPT